MGNIKQFINNQIKNILTEEEDGEGRSFEDMIKYLEDEKKTLTNTITVDTKVMSALANPLERKAKQDAIGINRNKIKDTDELIKNIKAQKAADDKTKAEMEKQAQIQSKQSIEISEQAPLIKQKNVAPLPAPVPVPQPLVKKARKTAVTFDSKTERPFRVTFTERGFSVEGTRLSFELLDNAISKNFTIVLEAGSGLSLNPVKIQKILKYRDLY